MINNRKYNVFCKQCNNQMTFVGWLTRGLLPYAETFECHENNQIVHKHSVSLSDFEDGFKKLLFENDYIIITKYNYLICPYCKEEFEPKVRWQLICKKDQCRKMLRSQTSADWRKKHPEYMKTYLKEYRKKYG